MQNQPWEGLLIAIDVEYLIQNAKDNHRTMTRISSVIWLQTMDKLEKWTSHVMTENLKQCCFEVCSSLLVTIKNVLTCDENIRIWCYQDRLGVLCCIFEIVKLVIPLFFEVLAPEL